MTIGACSYYFVKIVSKQTAKSKYLQVLVSNPREFVFVIDYYQCMMRNTVHTIATPTEEETQIQLRRQGLDRWIW